MTLPEGYALRPATPRDVDAMLAVATAYDLADFGRPDTAREHLEEMLRAPGPDAERDSWVIVEPGGSMAAFALAGLEGPALEAFGRVHPTHVGRGLGSRLVRATEERALALARERGGTLPLRNGVTSTDAAARRLLDDLGYGVARFFLHMERGLLRADLRAPEAADGVVVHAARGARDRRAAREALDEAFAGHWGWEPESYERWEGRLGAARGSVLVAAEADRVVGAITFASTSRGGWIEELGVRPPWRGRGLGAALLRHAFARLGAVGVREVRLNVDADNASGAARLYRRVGMRVRREWLVYEKRLRPG